MDPLTRLAHEAQAGDDQALTSFVRAAYNEVWRACAALVDKASGEDLAQETFLRAVAGLNRFRGDSSARTWLLGIAHHVCMNELRTRSRRRQRDISLEPATGWESSAYDASEGVTVADLVNSLEPERRAAFVLTQLLGLSYEEAAQVSQCPLGTIRSRVARARSELLERLGQHDLGRERHPRPSGGWFPAGGQP